MLKVGRIWRILATGFCFLMFTSGSLCLSCGFLPLLCLLTRDQQVLRRRTRFFVQKFFRFMTWLIEHTGCMRLRVEGVERPVNSYTERDRVLVVDALKEMGIM